MLHQFLIDNRVDLIARCRKKVVARQSPGPADSGLDHGVPLFLDQLIDQLCVRPSTNSTIREGATRHGSELLSKGYTVDQVVHRYGDVCQSVTDLAVELKTPITTDEFRTLNRCLDDAIADAVTEHGRQRDRSIADGHTERQETLAIELRNLIECASLAFAAIVSGNVGASGNTGKALERVLKELRAIVDRPLTDADKSSEAL